MSSPALGVSPSSARSTRTRTHRRLSKANDGPLLEMQNDDDAEKKERQRNKLLELQQNILHSPSTPSKDRQDLIGIAGLSNAQLADHYKNCIKLNNENKINAKNAFDLHLIDCMESMLKKKDSEMTNFQIASCSLDASAKIYAYRVDSVHSETFKIASGILGTAKKNTADKKRVSDVNNDEEENEPIKKKAKKKQTIEQNLDNLKLNTLETNYIMDPMLQKIRTSFDEGGTSGLLVNVLDQDNYGQLILDSTYPAFPLPESDISFDKESVVNISAFKDIFKQIVAEKPSICPQFREFSFLNWSLEDEALKVEQEKTCPNERNYKTKFAFDLEGIPEAEEDECEMQRPDFDDLDENSFSQDNSSPATYKSSTSVGERRELCKGNWKIEKLSDVFSVLSLEPSEYSYFDNKFISAWAGPNHWNIHPSRKTTQTNQPRKKQPKEVERLIFEGITNLDEKLKISKTSNTLSQKTLHQWNKMSTTLPSDLHYDTRYLSQLFLKPTVLMKRKKDSTGDNDFHGSFVQDDDNDANYERFCPSDEAENRVSADATIAFVNINKELFNQTALEQTCLVTADTTLAADMSFMGTSLVQQPFKIPKNTVPYAKRAKKINVKRLKTTIWNVLGNKEEVQKTETSDDIKMNFSEMYHNLRRQVSGTTIEDLTPHIAFVCLLYLANEKNLELQGDGKMRDFLIEGQLARQEK